MKDSDIRAKLRTTILNKYYNDSCSRVVDEMGISCGEAIVDIAVINGSLHGYEIKSEYDTLNRLPRQLSAYQKTFDYLTVICAQKHLPHLSSLLPNWCGIIVIDSPENKCAERLRFLKKPKKNFHTDKYSIAQLLWRDEVIEVLAEFGFTKGIKSKPKLVLWKLLAESIDKKTLSEKVREKLKLRAKWKSDEPPSGNDGYFQLSSK